MSDLASFNKIQLLNIWGMYPRCLLSGRREHVEFHHAMGRGGKYNRKIHSSIFNAVPLDHDIHAFAPLHDTDLQSFFLTAVSKHVMTAVVIGNYELTESDREFRNQYFPLSE